MTERVAILLLVVFLGVVVLMGLRWYRNRGAGGPERLDIDALGLELMAGCCAFVVFTTPTCKPCKAALRVVGDAAEQTPGPTEVLAIDAIERSDVALGAQVRTIPTVFLITASGHVVRRWRNVPQPHDVRAALAEL